MAISNKLRRGFVSVAASPLPILLLAAALRGGFAWDYQSHLSHRALASIPFLFESGNIAASLAGGHGFASPFRVDTGPTAWMTPLYPLLLAGIMRIFGIYTFASWVAAVTMNGCFSTLACLPVYYAGKRVGGAPLAALAGFLWAVFPNAILLSYQSLWETSLSALLGATLIWATLRLPDTRRTSSWLLYGLLWGVALMANASLLALLPFCIAWAFKSLKPGLIVLATVTLCCVPWTVRNYAVFHTFVPLRSVLGLQLWVGNNPDAKVMWLGGQHPIHETAEREQYVAEGEIAYMRHKQDAALAYIFTHPAREARLIGGRFVMFWSGGSEHPLDDFRQSKSAWFRYVLLFNLVAALGALVAIVLLFADRNRYALPLAVGPVVFPCAYYLTLALPRYRHSIDPTLMLLLAWLLCRSVTSLALFRARPRASVPPPASSGY